MKKSEANIEIIRISPDLPCAFDCLRTATVATIKPLERRKLGLHYIRSWEILPICDLHLRLIKRDIEVQQRMREIEQDNNDQ